MSFAERVKEEITRKTFTTKGKVCNMEQDFSGARPAKKRAFLRRAFLETGSMSDPGKAYHLEFVLENHKEAEIVRTLLSDFEIRAGLIERGGRSVVYLKSGTDIAALLRVIDAPVSLMEMENRLIYKDMRNNVNRRVNCDTANITKTVRAAEKQTAAIRFLEKSGELKRMEQSLRKAARLRRDNPDASVETLAGMMEPPLTKSGMYHRLQKITEKAESLKKAQLRKDGGEKGNGKNNRSH